jgi:predicted ATPase
MITEVSVKNYRSLAEETIPLERLTVLVGRNAAGKSNVVDVLRFVRDALRSGLDMAISQRGGLRALQRWSAKEAHQGQPHKAVGSHVEIGLRLILGEETDHPYHTRIVHYRFILGTATEDDYRVKEETCECQDEDVTDGFEIKNGTWVRGPEEVRKTATQARALTLPLLTGLQPFAQLYDFLTQMSFYAIIPDVLREPQVSTSSYPLQDNASNMASVLRELKQKNKARAKGLEASLERIVGDIDSYQVRQVGGYLVTRLRHQGMGGNGAPIFELFQESDGTLRILGILTALYQVPPRPLIALEEPELTIHPGALALLWEELTHVSRTSQVLITTHSPDLLDMCDADALRVVEKEGDVTRVGPVDPAQKAILKDRLLSPGQLMRGQGLYRAEGV